MNDPILDRLIDQYVEAVERQEGHPSRVALRHAIHEYKYNLEVEAFADGLRWAGLFPTEDMTQTEIRDVAPQAFEYLRSVKGQRDVRTWSRPQSPSPRS